MSDTTLADLFADYEAERLAEIAAYERRGDTAENRARMAAKRQAEAAAVIRARRRCIRSDRFVELSAWGIA